MSRRCVRDYEVDIDKSDSNSTMEKLRVDGANGLRFSVPKRRGSYFGPNSGSPFSCGFINASNADSSVRIPKSGINPNKAVFTIDSKTSQILIVNHNACQLLGYTSKELCSMQFSSLLTNKKKGHVSALAEGQLNSEDGTLVLLSGKVVEMNSKLGNKIAVSLWIRQIDNGGRCLAVAEPVERRITELIIDQDGIIIHGDYEAILLFQIDTENKLNDLEISTLIPAINLPNPIENVISKNIRKQKATGKTFSGASFPLCLMISDFDIENYKNDTALLNIIPGRKYYLITVWVFTNLSGLVVIDENGVIESINHHFSMLMFGYSETKILAEHITKLIPNFGQEFHYIGYRSRNATISSLDNESETETDPIYVDAGVKPTELIENECKELNISNNVVNKSENQSSSICLDFTNSSKNKNITQLDDTGLDDQNVTNEDCNVVDCLKELSLTDASIDTDLLTPVNEMNDVNNAFTPQSKKEIRMEHNFMTSSPFVSGTGVGALQQRKTYVDGNYRGEAIHNDGNIIDIIYTISCQILPCGRKVYCVWVSRDPESKYYDFDEEDERHQNLTLTFNSGNSQIDNSVGQPVVKTTLTAQNFSRPNSLSLISQCEEEQISGEFGQHYTTLKQIGKGAYGYVKMAYRNSDRLLVIAKFILKEKLCSQFMILTDDNKEVPMEIYLLSTVKHPNIVTVYDVFENEKFFQLVMEKHGSGMDLFEFIDRRPLMDEKLACFIFRQICYAVDYLHSLKILHRDIKDENIIIDQNFHVKLIDFGSATFMQEGKLFSTFFGTTEYCSPEVLAGNKYAGPELEMWSLGVTLYVLIFFENPFLDIEETLRGDLRIPHPITHELEHLLLSMLDKNPKTRCTMKHLMEDKWLNQDIIPSQFNFVNIVRCEPYESNPDKYYIGQKFSSATGLSTTSPQDSLSLVDDDSMVDAAEEDEDSIPSHDQDNAFKLESLPSLGYSESIGSVSSSSHFMTIDLNNDNLNQTGNLLNLSYTNSISDKVQDRINNKRNDNLFLMNDIDCNKSNSLKNNVNKLAIGKCSSEYKNYHHENDLKTNSQINLTDPDSTSSTYIDLKDFDFKFDDDVLDSVSVERSEQCNINYDKNNLLINSYSDSNLNETQENDNVAISIVLSPNNKGILNKNQSNNPLEFPKNSYSTDVSHKQVINRILPSITTTIVPSKSETNIFENSNKSKSNNKYTIYDVVSLNNLTSEDIFTDTSKMVDLSKTQILNKISDEDVTFDKN